MVELKCANCGKKVGTSDKAIDTTKTIMLCDVCRNLSRHLIKPDVRASLGMIETKKQSKQTYCVGCGQDLVTAFDITGDKTADRYYQWCPECSPHDGIKRTKDELIKAYKSGKVKKSTLVSAVASLKEVTEAAVVNDLE